MTDGINRWEENYHDSHIDKILTRVAHRKKTAFKSMDLNETAKSEKRRNKKPKRNNK